MIDTDFIIAIWCAGCGGVFFGTTGSLALQSYQIMTEAIRGKADKRRLAVLVLSTLSLSLISLGGMFTVIAILVFHQWPVFANFVVLLTGLGIWNAILAMGLVRGTGRVVLERAAGKNLA